MILIFLCSQLIVYVECAAFFILRTTKILELHNFI